MIEFNETPLVIHKFPIELVNEQLVHMPAGAHIISVMEQRHEIVLYAVVRPSDLLESVTIYVRGTGHPLNFAWNDYPRFLGTVSLHDGQLMFHVFEGRRA